ncbi:hypothetical protein MJO29_008593 [Puccinia striiformis f. sp. tritici]|uniref:Endoplasmic reticulum vesicle transporter C-terminal domain-containing protein n=1 Tax=Puccinia striiformis f. sp. tritici PST-78 TaxID=1165861 RepID=A0A0L0W261_9BASI|nr:hypothetical protein Pst134EA_015237 [Puccinia striiformis f. sp. tritici]KAI9603044.1 hypothetical protein H4Q26_002354 [Puccinia striiformis f. sp. tritici PST-130]KNE89286.1 hypothetical protein PSTG_17256 [Puccinia striiformis f. sp. tritici PST-78]KAH9452403.1 hypothetical protein Pst134EB_016357 [Puccinia striiformis f. sp. tritici]KAH9463154.1 hypothetical protein Pst134EA_015237 [Puccinia striiformis f. sp. tritici]KAI7952962.1 hypothetical protein MJO29_008593 [Puccinia striiformis
MEETTKSIMDLPAIREFDAFPKTLSSYKKRSSRGGILTVVVACLILLLIWHELQEYLFGEPSYSFHVDQSIAHSLGINIDLTVAMPCHYLSVDIKDAVGDRMYMNQEFKKEGTTFDIGDAKRIDHDNSTSQLSTSQILHASRKGHSFGKTRPLVPDGPACRIYGNTQVKKVTGNLHITTLGHGYLSWEHTDHKLMNLTHVITEFSFGQFFPKIVQPLDNSLELTDKPFHIFQYFISVVPTTYVDRLGRRLHTNQYSVTDMSRPVEHGAGIPGLFFKYDIEPMSLTIHQRTTSLIEFLVRLAGMIGGIVVCTGWTFRIVDRIIQKIVPGIVEEDHSSESSYSPLPIISPHAPSSSNLPNARRTFS